MTAKKDHTLTPAMLSDLDRTADVLNSLIITCEDGAHGFKTAAEDAKDIELKEIFVRYARQRSEFAELLRAHVRRLGCKPEHAASFTSKLHRGWMNLKSALSSNDAHAVLAECERGEDAALAAYREALTTSFDEFTLDLVSHQFTLVRQAHDHIRALRDNPAFATRK